MKKDIKTTKDLPTKPLYRCSPTKQNLITFAKTLLPYISEKTHFVCIGANYQKVSDSFGPMVGSLLEKKGFINVSGTMERGVHALNLDAISKDIPSDMFVIAIDASHVKEEYLGMVVIREGSLKPGTGVGRALPSIGNLSIYGGIAETKPSVDWDFLYNPVCIERAEKMAEFVAEAIDLAYLIKEVDLPVLIKSKK
jgi:putative sporulation protein YyaC